MILTAWPSDSGDGGVGWTCGLIALAAVGLPVVKVPVVILLYVIYAASRILTDNRHLHAQHTHVQTHTDGRTQS